jgi:hypothetical protein
MVRILNFAQVGELAREFQDRLVGVHVAELEEVDAFFCENLCHAHKVSI